MTTIYPYLFFTGNCREAMNFYKDCLGGNLTLQPVEDSPMAGQWPAEMQKGILHSMLEKGPLVLLASDMGDPTLKGIENTTIQLSLNCTTKEELQTHFSQLSRGGQVIREPHEFFAGTMAALTDKYGKSWMFYCEGK